MSGVATGPVPSIGLFFSYDSGMAEEWYYARRGERFGPLPFAKLKALAEQGWLVPADLVWNAALPDWRPAADVPGLFRRSLAETLAATVDGAIPGIRAAANRARAWQDAAGRRLEEQRLAGERQRVAAEATRLEAVPAAGPRLVPAEYYGPGEHVTVIHHAAERRWSPALAAVLSLLLPGLGQLYKGQLLNAVAWFLLVGFGYLALVLPGLVLHFFCVVGAASGNPWTAPRTEVVRRRGGSS